MRTLALLVLVAPVFGACHGDGPPNGAPVPAFPAASAERAAPTEAPYRFDRPVAAFILPDDLREISGLTVLDATHLGAIQDEDGQLYVLDVRTGRIVAVVPFGGPGDYEGVELAAGRLLVLRSDGVLTELEGWEEGTSRAPSYALDLPTACDAEGVGYDPTNGRLLIACKDGGLPVGNRKAIYAVNLSDWSLDRAPAYVLDARAIDGDDDLKPSAVAVHPVTGDVVVLSSKLPVLVILSPDDEVARTWDLAAAGFEQPEGLAFLPNGDLFIASEGDDGPPVLRRYAYEPSTP